MIHRFPQFTLLVLCCAFCTVASSAEFSEYEKPFPAPSLVLSDLNGSVHSLPDYRGKVVLINFWAAWCTPCVTEMPGMQRLVDKLASENFALLTVNISDPPARIREFMKRLDLDLPVLLDPNGATFKIWEGKILPTSFLVDPAGKVRYRVTGPMEWDDPEVITLLRHLAGSR